MGRASIISTNGSTTLPYSYHRAGSADQPYCRGPRRVIAFCILAILFPAVFISVPLIMRFVVYGRADYHVNPSDVRVVDERISTIWCKKQSLKSNISFTAYDSNGMPQVSKTEKHLRFHKTLLIPDDYKEYWGFYLLEGSRYRISTCARFKGGTLLIVKGRNHLNYCAYVGNTESTQDSDEFSDSRSDERNPSDSNFQSPYSPQLQTQTQSQSQSHQQQQKHSRVIPKGITSQEEMSLILAKIRAYVKKKPARYYKLREKVFDWGNVGHSSESGPVMQLNASASTSTSELWAAVSSVKQSTEPTTTGASISSTTSSPLPHPPPSAAFESGKLVRRKRHDVDVQRNSESGENGAYEDVNEHDDDVPLDSSLPSSQNTTPKPFSGPDSIWKSQHNLHTGVFNQSHPDDKSDSESESSYSSSEEALAKCEGIIANFYLKPLAECGILGRNSSTTGVGGSDMDMDDIPVLYEGNVTSSGYYYFIVGSENEKTDNFIRLGIELVKFEYELPTPIPGCVDVKSCALNLDFGSNQKMVISIPQPGPEDDADHVWDEYYVLESECDPRTGLYLIFVLCLPVMILLCAFQ